MRDITKKYFHLNSSAVYDSSAKNTKIVLLADISFSRNKADKICTSYNSTLLSFSSYNDIVTVQALLMEVLGRIIKSHIHIGLKRNTKVSDLNDFDLLIIKK